jgi:hypothetical protein
MADKEVRPIAKTTVNVLALPAFANRRYVTLFGLTKSQYRDLQAGKSAEIEKKHFDKVIMKEARDGVS